MNEQSKNYEVSVQHIPVGKIYAFISEDGSLKTGDYVMVEEEDKSSTIAVVVKDPVETAQTEGRKRILRKATCEDIQQSENFADLAIKHLSYCKERAKDRNLPMKMVGARFCENGKKLIVFFTSEGRVDFRALVKELAQTLKLRIELRQIGARDGSKYAGCFGPCGRMTCCSSYLRQFQSVSVAMAKNQSLSPNPSKLTGMCNKLKCCLTYENQVYSELRQNMPQIGDIVKTPTGNAYVKDIRVPSQKVYVQFEDSVMKWFSVNDINVVEKVKSEEYSSDDLNKYEKDEVLSVEAESEDVSKEKNEIKETSNNRTVKENSNDNNYNRKNKNRRERYAKK